MSEKHYFESVRIEPVRATLSREENVSVTRWSEMLNFGHEEVKMIIKQHAEIQS